jgi:hypothetical protein
MTHPHLRSRRFGGLLLAGAAAIVILAACSSAKPKAAPRKAFNPLSSTTTTSVDPNALHIPAGFQLPDTRFVSLTPVVGKAQPAPPIPVTGGQANVSGNVTGPGGAVAGATVRIERWVGSASGAITVATDGTGHYAASGLLGGHYKVRAWLAPTLTTFTAGTGFVADNGRLAVDLTLTQYNAYAVQVAANTGLAVVGQAFTLQALVTQQMVDGNGVVQQAPVAGQSVQLSTDPSVTIAGDNPGTTAASGLAGWTLTCTAAGSFTANVTAPNGSASTNLPACQPANTPTTTVPPPTVLPLDVGQSFTVPAVGPFPAGVYSASNASCVVTWEAYVAGAWVSGQSTGTMTLPGPGRSFVAAPHTAYCTYTRVS